MPIKSILLTGDDGYNAAGTRLLIHLLKGKYQLKIAGTQTQQSGVGGKMSIKTGFDWGRAQVDGVEAIWSNGTPADTIELATVIYKKPFDLIISGINWGANLGPALYSSGTVNAAFRAEACELGKKVLILSWDLPNIFFTIEHEPNESLEPYLDYPGKALAKTLDLIFKNKFFQAQILNVNFPEKPSSKVVITKLMQRMKLVWDYNYQNVPKNGGHFDYKAQRIFDPRVTDLYDVKAVTDNFISITPCKINLTDKKTFEKISQKHYNLD